MNTLFWCLHFLLEQPTATSQLKHEMSATRLKRPEHIAKEDFAIEELSEMRLLGKDNFTVTDLYGTVNIGYLVFTDCVLKETMRMTASSMSARRIMEDVEFFSPSQKRTIR